MTVYDQEKALWLTKFADLEAIRSFDENQETISPSKAKSITKPILLKKKAQTISAIPLHDQDKEKTPNLP